MRIFTYISLTYAWFSAKYLIFSSIYFSLIQKTFDLKSIPVKYCQVGASEGVYFSRSPNILSFILIVLSLILKCKAMSLFLCMEYLLISFSVMIMFMRNTVIVWPMFCLSCTRRKWRKAVGWRYNLTLSQVSNTGMPDLTTKWVRLD